MRVYTYANMFTVTNRGGGRGGGVLRFVAKLRFCGEI